MDMAIVMTFVTSIIFLLASVYAETSEASATHSKIHAFLYVTLLITAFVKIGANVILILFASADVLFFIAALCTKQDKSKDRDFAIYFQTYVLLYIIVAITALTN